jgi:trk system potassium uptake protein TrkH
MVLTDDMDYVTGHEFGHRHPDEHRAGLRGRGPSENYAFISDVGKWFLSWNMLVGRLEMFSALVIFYPVFLETVMRKHSQGGGISIGNRGERKGFRCR